MAQLTLNWPHGRYRKETEPAGSGETIAESYGAQEMLVREGAAVEKPVHECDTIFERLAKITPDADGSKEFADTFGLLRTRGRREPVETILGARETVRWLMAAKERDDWSAVLEFQKLNPRLVEFRWAIGEDEDGRQQLEFQPRNLYGFIIAQLIQDWASGATYKFCKRPGCDNYFYYGAGTKHRSTAQFCSSTCQNAHAYRERMEESK